MIVPDPKANIGDDVQALNSKCNPPRWESATLVDMRYHVVLPPWESQWSYGVRLKREDINGCRDYLRVGPSGIWSKP